MAVNPAGGITIAEIAAEIGGQSAPHTLSTLAGLSTGTFSGGGNNSAPHGMHEWSGYVHTVSMGTIDYDVRISTAQSSWGLKQTSNDDATPGNNAEADGGLVIWRTHDTSATYIRAKRTVLGALQGTRTDTGYVYDGGSSALTDANNGQIIITIPVSDVTIAATVTTLTGTLVTKATPTTPAPGDETGADLIMHRGAQDCEAESLPNGQGGTSEEHECIFKVTLTASKTGYETTILNAGINAAGIIFDAHNSATAEEEDEEDECSECCIHEDMLIATGEDMKSIHDIEIGDSVVSHNFETGQNELVEVEDKIVVERDVDYKINDLILTEDHPIYLNNGRKASIDPQSTLRNYKQEVDEVKVGDVMQKLDGSTEEITSIERYEGTHVNYTLKTKHNNFYANDILVSWVDSR